MTARSIPMSTFGTPDGGEDFIEYLRRGDVKVVQYVLVAETHSPAGTQVTTIREKGTEDEVLRPVTPCAGRRLSLFVQSAEHHLS